MPPTGDDRQTHLLNGRLVALRDFVYEDPASDLPPDERGVFHIVGHGEPGPSRCGPFRTPLSMTSPGSPCASHLHTA